MPFVLAESTGDIVAEFQRLAEGARRAVQDMKGVMRLWVKSMYPKWNPVKWKHGPKPAVPWWFNFDPYPYLRCFLLYRNEMQ